MDFASGLANLEQSAAKAQNQSDRRRARENDDRGDDHRRYQPRPRHNNPHQGRDGRGDYGRGGGRGGGGPNQRDRCLDGLARIGYRLPRGPYHRLPPISAHSDRPLHICLLAITIDDLPYESIWKAWATMSENPRLRVSLVCHAKHPERITSNWLKQRMLLRERRIVRGNSLSEPEFMSHKPAWGSVEITRAMVDLLVTGMTMGRKGEKTESDARFSPNRFVIQAGDPSVEELAQQDVPPADKFIFISETCVPVTTLDETAEALFFSNGAVAVKSSNEPEEKKKEPVKEETKKDDDKEETKKEDVADEAKEGEATESKKEEAAPTESESNPSKEESNNKTDGDGNAAANEKVTDNKTTTATATTPAEQLMHLDVSWVNARNFNSPNTPSNKYERDQFGGIHKVVPKRYRWKADQWMCLSRTHAAAILDLDRNGNIIPTKDQLWNSFRRINASDEMYFPTTLALAGILVDTSPAAINRNNYYNNRQQPQQQAIIPAVTVDEGKPWLEKRRITYTDWSVGARNPACFTNGIRDFAKIARLARPQGCLLARKFAPYLEIPGQDVSTLKRTGEISVEDWKQEIETIRQAEIDKRKTVPS